MDTFNEEFVTDVLTLDDVKELKQAIFNSTQVVIDLETTGLDEHAVDGGATNGGVGARIVLASLTLPREGPEEEPRTWVVPLSHPDSPWARQWTKLMTYIARWIKESQRPVVNQNMKFDARWIYATTGIDLAGQIEWDTQIAAHLMNENESHKLKELVPQIFGVDRWDDFDLKKPGAAETVELERLGMYAARDTYWTWKLAEWQKYQLFIGSDDDPEDQDEVEAARLGHLMTWVSMPTTRTLTAIEQRGIAVDIPWVLEKISELEGIRDERFDVLSNLYENIDPKGASFAPTSNWFRAWSEEAVSRGDLRVIAMTPKGRPQWDKAVLSKLGAQGSKVATDLLNLRDAIKQLEFLKSWVKETTPEGRIHSTYHDGSVVTGRLSSSGPNMQQVTKKLRPAFVPSEGYYLVDLDYSQIELRVAAFISRCEPMLNAFREGYDLHRLLGARISHKKFEDVTPEERQKAKSANFGLLYGMGPDGFQMYAENSYGVVMSREEAHDVHNTFFQMWKGISEWHVKSANKVHSIGQITSPIGRVRRLPDIYSPLDKKVSYAERASVNAPVQGFASDLMQTAAASIEGMIPGLNGVEGVRLVGTVHDSILVEVPANDWKSKTEECLERMKSVSRWLESKFSFVMDVPLEAEASVGTRWGLADVGEL